ncbi:MAG: hypothetical protein ABIR60_10785 [Allosphingosinicella sp.]
MAEDSAPFRAKPDDDDIPEADDNFFKHARIRRGNVIIREATGRLTREGVVPYPTAKEDER